MKDFRQSQIKIISSVPQTTTAGWEVSEEEALCEDSTESTGCASVETGDNKGYTQALKSGREEKANSFPRYSLTPRRTKRKRQKLLRLFDSEWLSCNL